MNTVTEKVRNDIRRRANAVHNAFQSKEAFIRFLETDESARGRELERNPWNNQDLDISPPEHWTWRWWNYAAFWWAYGAPPIFLTRLFLLMLHRLLIRGLDHWIFAGIYRAVIMAR